MNPALLEMFRSFLSFFEMIKFEHSVFALPFAYLGLLLAEGGWPRLPLLLGVTVAMVSFRTMAMSLNRLIDCDIDSRNPRTENRALPAGRLKPLFVWGVALLSLVIFEISAFKLNPLCFALSPVPVFLAWLYPWTKRFTWLSHILLGMILGIAPYGAWLASRGEFSWIPLWLTLGVTAWVAGFDILYALQDQEFDREQGLYSVPAVFNLSVSLNATWLLHALAVCSWLVAGRLAGAGVVYIAGVGLVALFLIRENWLIRSCGIAKMSESFFAMNAGVSVALLLVACADISLRGVLS